MKSTFKVIVLIFAALTFAGCTGEPPCPPGSKLEGEGPPEGSETWCAKTVNGQEIKDGPISIYRPDGSKMIQGNYHDGRQDGEWIMWHDNGQKAAVDHYKNGVQEGEHDGWYTNGKIAAVGKYKNGKRDGVWKRWDPNGFRNWEETYKDDRKVQ